MCRQFLFLRHMHFQCEGAALFPSPHSSGMFKVRGGVHLKAAAINYEIQGDHL